MKSLHAACVTALIVYAPLACAQEAPESSAAYQLGRIAGIAVVVYLLWRVFRKRKS